MLNRARFLTDSSDLMPIFIGHYAPFSELTI